MRQVCQFLESTKTDVGLFLDFEMYGIDYDDGLDDSNKIRSSTGATAIGFPIDLLSLFSNITKASTDKTESFNFNLGLLFKYSNKNSF